MIFGAKAAVHFAESRSNLIDGRLQREWPEDEIKELRLNGKGFDAAIAESMQH
jgi:hypothetical protein